MYRHLFFGMNKKKLLLNFGIIFVFRKDSNKIPA